MSDVHMQAMQLDQPRQPLQLRELPVPIPAAGQLLIRVSVCGVCRTDLHIADGDLTQCRYPVIPGHEIVGRVVQAGPGVEGFAAGQRVGVPWLGYACGQCRHCLGGRENLCEQARFTGCHIPGGYAQYAVADARFSFPLPEDYSDAQAVPLLCAGLIGYRSLTMAGDARRLGIYGFGAAAHIVAQVAQYQGREIYAFSRPGDREAQQFARDLGAAWTGDSSQPPPELLDAAIIFAPVGALVPAALRAVDRGGRVVCAGIHMSDIPAFPYAILWGERSVLSVANLTRRDAQEFLALAPQIPIRTSIETMPLAQANEALTKLREGKLMGAAVLVT